MPAWHSFLNTQLVAISHGPLTGPLIEKDPFQTLLNKFSFFFKEEEIFVSFGWAFLEVAGCRDLAAVQQMGQVRIQVALEPRDTWPENTSLFWDKERPGQQEDEIPK